MPLRQDSQSVFFATESLLQRLSLCGHEPLPGKKQTTPLKIEGVSLSEEILKDRDNAK